MLDCPSLCAATAAYSQGSRQRRFGTLLPDTERLPWEGCGQLPACAMPPEYLCTKIGVRLHSAAPLRTYACKQQRRIQLEVKTTAASTVWTLRKAVNFDCFHCYGSFTRVYRTDLPQTAKQREGLSATSEPLKSCYKLLKAAAS